MGELVADLFMSLDGFAGAVDAGPYFGYAGPELEAWIDDHLDRPQQVVLGRRTYQALASIAAGAGDDAVQGRLSALPKLVVSQTLEEPLGWENSRLVRGDPVRSLARLKRESATPLRTMGSPTLVRTLLRAGVVDRLRLTVFPLVLGPRGREPVFDGVAPRRLVLEASRVLDGRVLSLEYRPQDG